MKKHLGKRAAAAFLSAAMVVSMLPVQLHAEEIEITEQAVQPSAAEENTVSTADGENERVSENGWAVQRQGGKSECRASGRLDHPDREWSGD